MSKWPMAKLGDLGTITSGTTPKTNNPEYWDGNIPWVTPAELDNETKYVYDTERKITELGLKSSSLKLMPVNTVLLSSRAPIGKVAIAAVEMCCNQGFKNIICGEKLLPEYLYYYLKGKTSYLNSLGRGATFAEISKGIVEEIPIPLPPIEEQKRIAAMLDKAQSLIDLRKKQIAEMDVLVKAKFIEMFGTIDDTSYEVNTLGTLCEFVKDGTHQTPTYTDDSINGFKFLSSKDVTSGRIDWSNIKYIPSDLHTRLYSRLAPKKGDILLAKNGTTGISAVIETDEIFDIYVSLALLRFKPGVNVLYMWAAINSSDSKRQFDSSLKGIGVPNLHLGEIKKLKIVNPPLYLQNEFASFVKNVDKSKLAKRNALTEIESLYNALMQQAFGEGGLYG